MKKQRSHKGQGRFGEGNISFPLNIMQFQMYGEGGVNNHSYRYYSTRFTFTLNCMPGGYQITVSNNKNGKSVTKLMPVNDFTKRKTGETSPVAVRAIVDAMREAEGLYLRNIKDIA